MKNSKVFVILTVLLSIITGTSASHLQAASPKGKPVRLMSYNIRNGNGMDNRRDLQRIAEVMSRHHPDVVAVQEVDSMTHRSGKTDVLQVLARHTGLHATYSPAISYDGGKYGIGVLSREVPASVRRIPLPGSEERRTLLRVEFKEFVLLATHLSLTAKDRKSSCDIILCEAEQSTKPVLLAGDMNALPDDDSLKPLQRLFTLLSDSTWTTCGNSCIDHIYLYTPEGTEGHSTDRMLVDDRISSDHAPIYVDVRLERLPSNLKRDAKETKHIHP